MTQQFITAQDLYNIASVSDPRFSPDGKWLAHVRTVMDEENNEYKSAIWLAPAGGSSEDGGRLRQFTNSGKRDNSPRWSPCGRWLAFISDRGDEKAKPQIYIIPTDGGEARQLVKMENGAGELAWSPDGTRIAFTSRLNTAEIEAEDEPEPDTPPEPEDVQRLAAEKAKQEEKKADPRIIRRFGYRAGTSYYDDRTAHLYVVQIDPETGQAGDKPKRLTRDERNYGNPRWMPDGGSLLAEVTRKPDTDDLFYFPDLVRVHLDGGEPEFLTGPDTADINPWPSPDERWIAYNSQPVDEITTANGEIKVIPAAGGEPRVLTAELDAHADLLRWSPDSQYIYLLSYERGIVDLRRVSLDGGPVETLLTGEREIQGCDISPDGQSLGFVASTDRAPSDLYWARLDGTGEERLTEINGEWLAERTLGEVEDLWFESADGTPIHGWTIKPPDFDPEKKYPLVLSIHGGPHVMWSRHEPTMWHEWQQQAANGYVVFASNPRGSDGYGRDFRAALLKHWGEADLPDLMAGVEKVVAKGYVDPDRLVITGGSYGGFMTSWVIGHDQRFKAAVAQRGVYDLLSFTGTTDVPRLIDWEFESKPWEDAQRLWRYSPVAYAEEIHTPLLLIHSDSDFRAPVPSAEGLFLALRWLKREVEMVRYPREGHELSRSGEPKHRIDRLERIVAWFDKYAK